MSAGIGSVGEQEVSVRLFYVWRGRERPQNPEVMDEETLKHLIGLAKTDETTRESRELNYSEVPDEDR